MIPLCPRTTAVESSIRVAVVHLPETNDYPSRKLVIFEESPWGMGSSQFTIHDSVKEELEKAYTNICNALCEVDGIEDAGDYVEKIDQEDGASDFSGDVIEKFSEVPMRALTRAYPGGNQDIVIAELNPKLNTDPAYLNGGESEELGPLDYIAPVADEGAYTDDFVTACVNDWNNNNYGDIGKQVYYRRELLHELNNIGSTVEFTNINEYTYESDPPSVYRDIYFTNIYKFATNRGDDLNAFNSIKKASTDVFISEISQVNPDLVIGAFDQGVSDSGLFETLSPDPPNDGPEDLSNINVSDIHGEIYNVPEWDNARLVTTAHPGNRYEFYPPAGALADQEVARVV